MHPERLMRHGQFLGDYAIRRAARGFSFAELTPTVPASQVRTHTHADAHFVLLLRGDYVSSAKIEGPPLLIYNPPGTTHRDHFRGLDGRFFTISVSTESLQHAAEYVTLHQQAVVIREGHAVWLACQLRQECRQWADVSPLVAEGIALELLAAMSRGSERRHRQAPRWLAGARESLRQSCADGIRISAVAAAAGVHPVHLIRTFREFFCATPGEYVRRCRLERAARLLADSDVSLVDVALESGYADQSHFSKAFKRQFAIAPSQYRRDVNSVQEATTPL